jgi:hypothetical protein
MMKSLNLDEIEVVSFATNDEPAVFADDSSFQRGCNTWAFSCGGTCAYTCGGGFCESVLVPMTNPIAVSEVD